MKISHLFFLLFFGIATGNAATITSTTSGGNWTLGATWVGGVAPVAADEVVINGNVSVNADAACAKITINSGKTLSFATGGFVLTLTNPGWQTIFTNNGTFTAGDGTVKMVTAGNGLTVSGTVTFNNVILDGVVQMNMGGSATVNGTMKLVNANFGYNNNNHPVYGPNATLEVNGTYSPSTNPLIWATDNSNKTAPNIVIASGTVTANQGQLYLKGTFTVASGATFNGASGCTFMVSGFQRITNYGTIALGGVIVKSGAVWNVTANFSIATLKIENGGVVNANSYTLTVNNGSINNCGGISGIMQLEAGGTFNPGTSTIVFVPAFYSNVTADVSGPINFTNVVVSGSSPINVPTDNSVTVSGNVTVSSGATVNNPGNMIFDSTATISNSGTTSGDGFPPTVPTTPVINNYLTGTVSGSKAGAISVQTNTTATLSGNVNITGTSKTLTVAPGSELMMGSYIINVDTVFVYGKLTIGNTGGLTSAFTRTAGTPVIKIGTGSTVIYDCATAQTITQRGDYVTLNLKGAGTKTFAAGAYTIRGDFTVDSGSADITTNSPTFTFNGENNQSIEGLPYSSISFGGEGSKTLLDSTSATGVVSLSGSANLISNGLLTLKSTAAGTASIGAITGTATITGNINYQRYIPAGRLWRFIGWPISGNTFANTWQNQIYITGPGTGNTVGTTNSNGFDATPTNSSGLYYYNEASTASIDNKWTTISNTNTTISSTTGYRLFIRGPRSQGTTQLTITSHPVFPVTLTGTGAPNKGDIAVSLSCSNGCGANNGWHILSNPYPSAIDWNNTNWKNARNANIGSTIYVYNPAQNKYGAWSPTGGSVNGGSANIASGQAFFIKTNAATTLTFKEEYKVNNATVGLFAKSSGLTDNLKIQIGDNIKVYDETVVYMYPSATRGFDQDLDAVKPDVTNASISTYTIANNSKLIFNAIPELMNGDSASILLHVPLANATYTYNLSFIGTETFGNATAQFLLFDHYTNSTAVISQLAPVYSFSTTAGVAASYDTARFVLKITTATGSLPVKLVSFYGQKKDGKSSLHWTTSSEINNDYFAIQRSKDGISYETIGTVAGAKYSNKPLSYSFMDETPFAGINYYRLKQVDGDGKVTFSTVININYKQESIKTTVTAWPVPAEDYLTIELNNKQPVRTTVIIKDMIGKVVYEEEILAEETDYSHPVWVENFKSGVYFLELKQENQTAESIKFVKK